MAKTQVPGWRKESENHYVKKETTLAKEEVWLRKIGDKYVVIWQSTSNRSGSSARIPQDRPINRRVFNSKDDAERAARKWMRFMREDL